jgi:hypothetical protein
MAIRTVGPNSTYASIAAAMADSGPGDTIQLEPGYSNETATILYSGMIVTGQASSTGIVLDLGIGVATVTLEGEAPIDVNDALDGNGIVGNDGDNLIRVTDGADSVSGGAGDDRLFIDYRLATGAITGTAASVAEAGGSRLVTINGGFEHLTVWTGAGADTITTGDGDDDIRTGEGAGTVTAGEGFNTIIGGSGADTITAGNGGNYVDGGDGANTITTGDGEDEILTGTGADTIVSGGAADRITVTGGADSADAGAGSDLLIIDYSAAVTAVTGGVTGGNLETGYTGQIGDLAGATLDFVGVETMHVTTGSGNDTVTTGGGQRQARRRRRQRPLLSPPRRRRFRLGRERQRHSPVRRGDDLGGPGRRRRRNRHRRSAGRLCRRPRLDRQCARDREHLAARRLEHQPGRSRDQPLRLPAHHPRRQFRGGRPGPDQRLGAARRRGFHVRWLGRDGREVRHLRRPGHGRPDRRRRQRHLLLRRGRALRRGRQGQWRRRL